MAESSALNKRLLSASKSGDLPQLRRLLGNGARDIDVNCQDEREFTPLHLAAVYNHADVVGELLMSHGVRVELPDKQGLHPIHSAAQFGHVTVIERLLRHGVKANARTVQGQTPLYQACVGGQVGAAYALLGKGADPRERTGDGSTLLHGACWAGHLEVIEFLLQMGLEKDAATTEGYTPLHVASLRGHDPVVNALLSVGADRQAPSRNGSTPLYVASREGHTAVVRALLEGGADPGRGKPDGFVPLHIACQKGHLECVRALLPRCDVNTRTTGDVTPLMLACIGDMRQCAELLLRAGADLYRRDKSGLDALTRAAKSGSVSCVRLLLETGVRVDWAHRECPIALAQKKRHFDIARVLTKYKERSGRTPDTVSHAAQQLDIIALSIPPREVKLQRYHVPAANRRVRSSTPQFYASLHNDIRRGKIYNMRSARKGKALIICLAKFGVEDLSDLPGYTHDREKLTHTLGDIGFEVYCPFIQDSRDLTAAEVKISMEHFSALLAPADQCSCVCILSHGGDGYLYGYDGKRILVNDILHSLSNINCVRMAGKPKLFIFQTCQGDGSDLGVSVNNLVDSASRAQLPTLSDMLICYPTMPGYQSYTHQNDGSFYINKLIQILEEKCADQEVNSMLTDVNAAVQQTDIPFGNNTVKQSANYRNCLTKKLYLFPCPSGRAGQDWKE